MTKAVKTDSDCKITDPSSSVHWFTDQTLETRLHHIIHNVQNNEWPLSNKNHADLIARGINATPPHNSSPLPTSSPGPSASPLPRSSQSFQSQLPSQSLLSKHKKHIAIDVETERAKLHALLNTPSLSAAQSEFLANINCCFCFCCYILIYFLF